MKEEGRRKKEEGRRKKEEGRRKKEEGVYMSIRLVLSPKSLSRLHTATSLHSYNFFTTNSLTELYWFICGLGLQLKTEKPI